MMLGTNKERETMIKKFTLGERVIFDRQGEKYIGRVTGMLDKKRRVVADTGERAEIPLKGLKRAPDHVLILETRLDRSLHSTKRTYAPMLKQFLEAYPRVKVLHERVHTGQEFANFLHTEGRKITTRFIHYIGHGINRSPNSTSLNLTHGKLNLHEETSVFSRLNGKVIIFSCCEVGANQRVMAQIKESSNAAAVIAYRTEVCDTYTNLAEALLYDRLFSGISPHAAVQLVANGLTSMGIRADGSRKPVLVCV